MLASTAVIAAAAVITGLAPVSALGVTGPGSSGLAPEPTPADQPRPYFELTIAPGRAARDAVVVSNAGATTERLRIGTAPGLTAQNSGSAFGGLSARCAGAACWVTGLPATVTLAPRTETIVRFTVTVTVTHRCSRPRKTLRPGWP